MRRQPIYVDESIHDRPGFIVTAIVIPSRPVDDLVDAALLKAGLSPGRDEFKSSLRMAGNPHLQQLRLDLLGAMHKAECRLALVVSNRAERARIDVQLFHLLEAMQERGRFNNRPLDVFIDQGIATHEAQAALRDSQVLKRSRFLSGQDSRLIRGLQIADMCAHNIATMLLADLGLAKRTVLAGDNLPFDPEEELDLDWALLASLRECLASSERACPGETREPTSFTEFDAFGLFVSDNCIPAVKRAALDRFAAIYMGCII